MPLDLIQLFSSDNDVESHIAAIVDTLGDIGISGDKLPDLFGHFQDIVQDIPPEYLTLLKPVGGFVEETQGDDPGLVQWQLLEARQDASRQLNKGVMLEIGGAADASIQFEAGHKSPFDEDETRYLRIGLVAGAKVDASVTIPLNLGSVSGGAGAGGKVNINYLLDVPDTNLPYAIAIATATGSLANPMDLDSI
jgi:hypothetical protein